MIEKINVAIHWHGGAESAMASISALSAFLESNGHSCVRPWEEDATSAQIVIVAVRPEFLTLDEFTRELTKLRESGQSLLFVWEKRPLIRGDGLFRTNDTVTHHLSITELIGVP